MGEFIICEVIVPAMSSGIKHFLNKLCVLTVRSFINYIRAFQYLLQRNCVLTVLTQTFNFLCYLLQNI